MTGQGTAYAALPPRQQTTDAPVNNVEQATLETPRVLFCAHDTISDREKRELRFKEFGGIHLPHIRGLRDTKGMLYQCTLTRLPEFTMKPDWDMMLPPAERESGKWVKSFTQTIVDAAGHAKQRLINGFLESDARALKEDGEFKQRRSNHVVYSKTYPLHEVRLAQRRFGAYTTGGVVEIEALAGASEAEIEEVQYFFFPNWESIPLGEEMLPATTKGMQAHLKGRIDSIANLSWDGEKKKKYYSIGKDMMRSSTEYERTAKEAVRTDELGAKSAFTKGDTGATTSSISEKYLEQTGSRRKEDLITGEASATAELVQEMKAERAEKSEIARTRLLLEERKQYVAEIQAGLRERDDEEEIRLGIKKTSEPKVDVPVAEVVEPSLPENTEVNTVAVDPPANTEAFEVEGISNRTAMGEKEASYNIGDKIPVAGGEAEVIAKPFGRIKVRLADGTETMLDKL